MSTLDDKLEYSVQHSKCHDFFFQKCLKIDTTDTEAPQSVLITSHNFEIKREIKQFCEIVVRKRYLLYLFSFFFTYAFILIN